MRVPCEPSRVNTSRRLSEQARTRMRTSFGPTKGSGNSPNLSTSGDPVSVRYTAFINTLLNHGSHSPRRLPGRGKRHQPKESTSLQGQIGGIEPLLIKHYRPHRRG